MDINRLIDGFIGSGSEQQASPGQQKKSGLSNAMSGFPGGLAGGAAAGGLVALMLGSKKARKLGGKALTYGGMAAVGGLAYKAYSDYRKSQQSLPSQQGQAAPPRSVPPEPIRSIPPAPADSGFDPAQQQDRNGNDLRLGLVQAMISAAKADGHIDTAENDNIRAQINSTNLAADEKGFLFDQLGAASDPIAIANLAGDETQASELYLASALTIDINTPEESRYMERLGDALRLPDALRQQLLAHAEAAKAGSE
ncbi:MAG: DUF533 domain-containing protein [Alphaproteobacteria bacterium]